MKTNSSLESALDRLRDRRAFLKFLAGSPYIAALGGVSAAAFDTQQASTAIGDVIATPKDALDVMDFEALARKALPPAHWGYMATGVDDDLTLNMNREAFHHYQLRARRLVDVAAVDLKTDVLGELLKDRPLFTQ